MHVQELLERTDSLTTAKVKIISATRLLSGQKQEGTQNQMKQTLQKMP